MAGYGFGPNYGYGYNPMMNTQQRLAAMEQQYPQFAQQPVPGLSPQMVQAQNQNVGFLKGRLVTGIDEARAAIIDFDGSIAVFPDISNNKIYTKQINLDGSAALKTYVLEASPLQNVATSQEAAQPQVDVVQLRKDVDELKEVVASVQSYAVNVNASRKRQSNGNDATDAR